MVKAARRRLVWTAKTTQRRVRFVAMRRVTPSLCRVATFSVVSARSLSSSARIVERTSSDLCADTCKCDRTAKCLCNRTLVCTSTTVDMNWNHISTLVSSFTNQCNYLVNQFFGTISRQPRSRLVCLLSHILVHIRACAGQYVRILYVRMFDMFWWRFTLCITLCDTQRAWKETQEVKSRLSWSRWILSISCVRMQSCWPADMLKKSKLLSNPVKEKLSSHSVQVYVAWAGHEASRSYFAQSQPDVGSCYRVWILRDTEQRCTFCREAIQKIVQTFNTLTLDRASCKVGFRYRDALCSLCPVLDWT